MFIPEAGLLTVTKVAITDDLKLAKVYFSFLENKKPIEDVLGILVSKQKLIRHLMGLRLTLKHIPKLHFYYDDSIEHAQKINDLIQRIYKND